MGFVDIKRLLPNDNYEAIIGSTSSPSASNPYATLADLYPSYTELDPVINQITTPPGGESVGDRYLVAVGGVGAFAGQDNNIAEVTSIGPTVYSFTVPVLDNIVEIINLGVYKRFNGASWVAYGGTSILQGGNSLATAMSIGTKTNQVVYIRTNNTNRVRFTNTQMNITGSLYLGSLTATASAKLHIAQTSGELVRVTGVAAAVMMTIHSDGTFTIGEGATAFDDTSVSIGKSAAVSGTGGIAIGVSSVSVSDTVAIGNGASALINRGVAIGLSASSTSQGVSIGYASSTNDRGVAIGYSAVSTGSSVAIGESASAVGGISIKGTSVSSSQVSIGGTVSGAALLAVGVATEASGDNGIAIGFRSRALATDSIIIGRSVDNATFLDNNTAQSFGIGWSEATPTVLFAKTSTQYINGTGDLGIGLTSPTAKLHIRGTNTSSATKSFLVQNANPTNMFSIQNDGSVWFNGGVGNGGGFEIHQISGLSLIMDVYNASFSRRHFTISDNGVTPYLSLGGQPSDFATVNIFPNSAGAYGSLQLNSFFAGNSYQLFSNRAGVSYNHVAFINGAGGGFTLIQNASQYYELQLQSFTGVGTSVLLSSDSDSYLAGISTQNLGVGIAPSGAKFHVKGSGNTNATYWLKAQNSDNEVLYAHTNGGIIEHYTNTAVGASVTDGYLQYSADVTPGNAAPHFKTEAGNVIKLFTSAAYTPTNVTTDRSYNANVTSILELADVLGTLITDLQATGIIG